MLSKCKLLPRTDLGGLFMKKNALIAAIIIVSIVFLLTAIGIGTSMFNMFKHLDTPIPMFANIEECSALDADGKFTPYSDVSNDSHIQNLPYTAFFAGQYKDDAVKFEIFAYEFPDTESARAYFQNITGKASENMTHNYSLSDGMFGGRLAVFQDHRAYIVSCSYNMIWEIVAVLEEIFSLGVK